MLRNVVSPANKCKVRVLLNKCAPRRMGATLVSTWMENPHQLDVLEYPDAKLLEPSVDLTTNEMISLITSGVLPRLFDLMYKNDGVGIAAPQVGINKRFLVMNKTGRDNLSSEMVFMNPKIVSKSEETTRLREACISLPDIEARVERHCMVEVNAVFFNREKLYDTMQALASPSLLNQDISIISKYFEEKTVQLRGKTAQIFQHEVDHLDGVLFTDRMYLLTDKKNVRPKLTGLKRRASMSMSQSGVI